MVVILGFLLSLPFCTNFGWVLFDLTEHYITSYIVVMVGIFQCVSCGWLFEYNTTAMQSPEHLRSLRYLATLYWIPMLLLGFYCNFFWPDNAFFGILACIFTTAIACYVSAKKFKRDDQTKADGSREFKSWLNEILYCGVNKLSMSITALSDVDPVTGKVGKEKWWMAPFWQWFGISIKLINPCCLWFILCNNLYNDLTSPYADQELRMHLFAMIYVIVALIIIVIPMFVCGYPENFNHKVNKEFEADEIYEKVIKKQRMMEFAERNRANNATGNIDTINASKTIELKDATANPAEADKTNA
jgi:hypothetical protein